MGSDHAVGKASIDYLENIRGVVGALAEEAGLRDPDGFARSWHILMKGSIISAAEGDRDAAQRAKLMARSLIDQYRYTRREMRLSPENIQAVVEIALDLAGQPPLVPARTKGIWPDPADKRTACPVFHLPALP